MDTRQATNREQEKTQSTQNKQGIMRYGFAKDNNKSPSSFVVLPIIKATTHERCKMQECGIG